MGVAIVAYDDSSSGLRFVGLRYYCCSYGYLAELCTQHSSKQYLDHRLLDDAGNLCRTPLCGINGRLNPDFFQSSCFSPIYINIGIKELLKKIKKNLQKDLQIQKKSLPLHPQLRDKGSETCEKHLEKGRKTRKTNFFRKKLQKSSFKIW